MKTLYIILFNFLAAGGLFFLNGLLGKLQSSEDGDLFSYGEFHFYAAGEPVSFAGNFFQKIVNPTIFVAVVAALCQYFGWADLANCAWQIVPCFWIWRLGFMLLRNTFAFINRKYELFAFLSSMVLCAGTFKGIIQPLLAQGKSVWMSLEALRDALWFAIIAYILTTVWKILSSAFQEQNLYSNDARTAVIRRQYRKFSKRYGKIIGEELHDQLQGQVNPQKEKKICLLIYAIMIYEDYNRPPAFRLLEYIQKFFCPQKTMTLGIMQVKTQHLISSEQSIVLAIEKIIPKFLDGQPEPEWRAISSYNAGAQYYGEVMAIYDTLTYCIMWQE